MCFAREERAAAERKTRGLEVRAAARVNARRDIVVNDDDGERNLERARW